MNRQKIPRDGRDLGILIRLNQKTALGYKIPFDTVMSELISEVGWLKGGEKELQERLNNLEKHEFISHEMRDDLRNMKPYPVYFITEKGKDLFKTEDGIMCRIMTKNKGMYQRFFKGIVEEDIAWINVFEWKNNQRPKALMVKEFDEK